MKQNFWTPDLQIIINTLFQDFIFKASLWCIHFYNFLPVKLKLQLYFSIQKKAFYFYFNQLKIVYCGFLKTRKELENLQQYIKWHLSDKGIAI